MRRQTTIAKPNTVSKKWRTVDAKGQSLGRLAADIAIVLMGKHRPEYTPHVDCGDYVIVLNAKDVVMTGSKAEHKTARHYTGYPSGLKSQTYGQLLDRKPERVIELAVRRMLPKNRLGRVMLSNMRVFPGAEHPYGGHKPTELKV